MFSVSQALCKRRVTLSCLALLPLISSCAVQTPPQILNSIGGAHGTREIFLSAADEDSALRASFRDRLKTAFIDRAIAYNDNADVMGDFAISTLPANVELASTDSAPDSVHSDQTSQKSLVTQSAARKSLLLDNCEAVRFRATLVLFNRKSGERIHRAESEAFGCEGDQVPLSQLAIALVDNSLLSAR